MASKAISWRGLFILSILASQVQPYSSTSWKEVIGEREWEGLVHPLKPQLAKELTRYCNLIGVISQSFNTNANNSKSDLLKVAGLSNNYTVETYLYASTKNIMPKRDQTPHSNWVGYVAVSTDQGTRDLGRREIVIAIRGSVTSEEWFSKFCLEDLVSAHDIFKNDDAKLQEGRYNYYVAPDSQVYNNKSFRDQSLDAVKGLVAKYQKEENVSIVVTGFSMGGAFATLIATDIAYNGYNKMAGRAKAIPVTAFAFANSPVGNKGFVRVVSRIDHLYILRVAHESDENPLSPTTKEGYYHVGRELEIKMGVHNLNVYSQAITQAIQSQSSTPVCPIK